MNFKFDWHTEKHKLSELKELENNPRYISESNIELLKKDMEEQGVFKAFICNTDLVVLGGNQRLKILLEENGPDFEVEVSVPDRYLTKDEAQKVIINDNKHRGEDDIDTISEDYIRTVQELGYDDLYKKAKKENDNLDFEDTEVDTDMIQDTGLLAFRLPRNDYMKALALLANAVERTESETNEECIMKLLSQYE